MPDTTERRPYHHGNLRTDLLDAAERSLRAHGAEQLSLRDLARDVGVSHAAPRRHFADRRALLDALAESGFMRLGEDLRAAVNEIDDEYDLPARLHAFASAYVRFATENAALTGLMNSSKHRPGATAVAEAAAAAFGQISELIEDGQQRGELEGDDPEETGLVIYATVLGITSMLNSGMIEPARLEGLVSAAVTQFLRGARPAEPR
ncbi:TetR/AcrR family transcriptional regulator [Streptomyces sp. CHA1]|uniref:TetR/AcrR family transcriptional regulator n=1 Tax=unclassified Streptomyces TaxID=2593676 RepID=UPI001BFC337F|nr:MULTISPECIES: TetR/AcrR family transcriptional regulator [unclassified Streptomyces]MBT3161350.1 TetR/AcrR family transcriptional regulator [Streptomyces sp. G11C]MCO6699784.1 TetR/AcrR family transcriptional regulator [Streptomyces sp. CHB9.2]MCO6708942.1 TetR/AcrR family transcriptional regulator [Streptomyces sp. CHA3]MCO6714816.1 TetR/AcrR family transcriptional regulator [Streptomyces sp. CHB19.2]MCO6720938.1 TetR/AcrR family transcriptional regulator [Streptomyces sp. Vc714c-19]